MTCHFTWYAPYLHPDGRTTYHPQDCALPKKHKGDHRSLTKVTHSNLADREEP